MSFSQISCTPAAAELIRLLRDIHQCDLVFHQSGGCCDGSSPMCHPHSDFYVGPSHILLGEIENSPFYMDSAQYEYWQQSFLTIDATPGHGSSFSLEAPEGMRFLTRSRPLTENEQKLLAEINKSV